MIETVGDRPDYGLISRDDFEDWYDKIDAMKLKVSNFRVLMYLGMQRAARKNTFSMSIAVIANKCLLERATVRKSIKYLEKLGLIHLSPSKGGMNTFDVPIHFNDYYESIATSCCYCGKTSSLVLDHVIPKAQNGTGKKNNLAIACLACNFEKGARTPEQWLRGGI